jgi:hypothetical protein
LAFLVNYDEITNYGFGLNTKKHAWQEQLGDVAKSVNSFIQMDSFKGAAAQSVKTQSLYSTPRYGIMGA